MTAFPHPALEGKRVLVIGASGVLGSRVLDALFDHNCIVRALVGNGGRPVPVSNSKLEIARGSLFELDTLSGALRDVDLVLHLASRIPPGLAIRTAAGWTPNDRVRDEGTLNLVHALRIQPTSSLVMATVCGSAQRPDDHWSTAMSDVHALARSSLVAESHMEQLDGFVRWTALRFGRFVGRSIPSGKQILDTARLGLDPFIGRPEDPLSLIHIDDAAAAVIAAAASDLNGGYAVPGCAPRGRGEVADDLRVALRKRALVRLPALLAKVMLGVAYEPLCKPIEIVGTRFVTASQWNPRHTDSTAAILTD